MEGTAKHAMREGGDHGKAEAGLLIVEIVEAKDLSSTMLGSPNPYVIVEFGNKKAETEVVRNTNNPTWKTKFYFKTDDVPLNTEIIFTVMSSNQVVKDTAIGHLKYPFESILREKDQQVRLPKLQLLNNKFVESKQVEGKLDVVLTFQNLKEEGIDSNPKTRNVTMKKFKFDGVFKLNILSGTNLTMLNEFQYLFLEIIHQKTENPKRDTTKQKKQKNAHFNEIFYYDINEENKTFKIQAYNVHRERFIAGSCELDLEKYPLVRHKPKTYTLFLESGYQYKAELLCEMTFFYNFFTKFPQGRLTIDVKSLPKTDARQTLAYSIEIEGSKEVVKRFNQAGASKAFKTQGKLDKVIMTCFEQVLGLGSGVFASSSFYLCEIPWMKLTDTEYQSKKMVELIGKSGVLTANIELRYKSVEQWRTESLEKPSPALLKDETLPKESPEPSNKAENKELATSKSIVIKEEQKEVAFVQEAEEMVGDESAPPVQATLTKGNTKIFEKGNTKILEKGNTKMLEKWGSKIADNQQIVEKKEDSYQPKSCVLVISSVHLESFLLKVKLFEHPNYYFSLSAKHSPEVAFSSLSKSVMPQWEKEELIFYVSDIDEGLSLRLHELSFASVQNQAKQGIPIDILSGDLVVSDHKDFFGFFIKYTVNAKPTEEFKEFVKKNHIQNNDEFVKDPIQALDKVTFSLTFDGYGSYLIDEHYGILNLASVDGTDMALVSEKNVITKTTLQLQIALNQQIYNLTDKVDVSNPKWITNLNFFVNNPMDAFTVKVFDFNPEHNQILLDLMIPLYNLPIKKSGEKVLLSVDLSGYDVSLKGTLTFEFIYTAVPNVTNKSLKAFKNEQSDTLEIFRQKLSQGAKMPILVDWKQARQNEKFLVEIILDKIDLDFKLKQDFILTGEVKTNKQYYYLSKYINMTECIVNKKLSFIVNPSKEEEQVIIFTIKVCAKNNPGKILRLYSYIFDWSKYLAKASDYITVDAKLVASSMHTQEKDPANSIVLQYRITRPHMANASDVGLLGLQPVEVRTAGVSMEDIKVWTRIKVYILVVKYNGMKQVYRGRLGEPWKYTQSYICDADDDKFTDKVYDIKTFFTDKTDGSESVLEFTKENATPKYFPLTNNNERNIRFELYQMEPEGLATPLGQIKSNPSAKLMAKGFFDVLKLQQGYNGMYALKLHKELVLSCEGGLAQPVNLHFSNFYLTFKVEEYRFQYKEMENPNLSSLEQGETVRIKNVKELNSGVLLARAQTMEFASNQRSNMIGHVISFLTQQGKSSVSPKVTATLKNIISNPDQFFSHLAMSLNPVHSLFNKSNYISLPASNTAQFKFENIMLKVNRETQEVLLRQLSPDIAVEIERVPQSISLDGLAIGANSEVDLNADIWKENTLEGNAHLQFQYFESFFTKHPSGMFTIHKFEIIEQNGANLKGFNQIQFTIQPPPQIEEQDDKQAIKKMFLFAVDQLKVSDGAYQSPTSIDFKTHDKQTTVFIQLKEKSSNVVTKLKLNLFQLAFVNPQSIKTAKINPSDLLQEKIFIIPAPQPKAPGAYLLLKLWFYYKDQISLTNFNFQNIFTLMKFKQLLDAKTDKIRRIVYLNPGLKPLAFTGKFRRFYYGAAKADFSFLPLLQEKKIDDLMNKMLQDIAPKPSSSIAVNLNIPANSEFILPGVVSLKKPITIKIVYKTLDNQKGKTKEIKDVVLTHTLKLDNCEWKEVMENKQPCLRFKIINSIDFFFPQNDVIDNKVELMFEYFSKKEGLRTEKSPIDYTSFIIQSSQSKNELNMVQKFIAFLRPSNQKLYVNIKRMSSRFIDNPHGKLFLSIHRLVLLDEYEEGDRNLVYQNKSILLKNKALKGLKTADHYKFFMKLGVKVEHQKKLSTTLNHQGIPIDANPEEFVFWTSSFEKDLNINLQIETNPAKKDLSESIMEQLQNFNKPEKEEDIAGGKEIILAKARIPLASLPLAPNETYPVYFPLPKANYKENDLISRFLNSINRDNIYAVGTITFKPEPWYNLWLKLERVDKLMIKFPEGKSELNSTADDLEVQEDEEDFKFGLTIVVTRKTPAGDIQELYNYDSMIYDVWPTDNNAIQFRPDEYCSFFYEDRFSNDELSVNINLLRYRGGNKVVVGKLNLPIKKHFYSAIESKQPQKIEAKLARDRISRLEFINEKTTEFPLTIHFTATTNFKNIYTPKIKQTYVPLKTTPSFDFRENPLEDMLLAVINSSDKAVTAEALKEINEYLLYTNINESIGSSQATLLYNMFRFVYQLYPQINEMTHLAVRNILALFNFDSSLVHKINIIELLDELAEIIFQKVNKYQLGATDQELNQMTKNFKLKFVGSQLQGEKHRGSEPFAKENLSAVKSQDILAHMKNNLLSKEGRATSVEDKEHEQNHLMKTILYVMKILEIVCAQGEQYGPLITERCLSVITKVLLNYIKTDGLLLPYLQILRKVLIDYENVQVDESQIKNISACLEKVKVAEDEGQAETFLRVYCEVQKKKVSQAKTPEEKKAVYKATFGFLSDNYKEKQIFYHYQFFEMFMHFYEEYKTDINYTQDTINQLDLYPKLVNYLNHIIRFMEQKLSDLEIKQAVTVTEEIILRYEITNVNYDKISGFLQVIEHKEGINTVLQLKIENVRSKLRKGRESPLEKKRNLKERLKTLPKDNKNQDIKTKYLMSKLDWMG